MKKLNNDIRGFSLVEVIIVVSIMSVIIGVIGYGVSLSSGKPAEECAKKLSAAISHGRTTTMGKYRNVITVKKEDDGRLTVTESTFSSESDILNDSPSQKRFSTVGTKNVTVEYKIGTGSYVTMNNGDAIELRYDSGSGAMKKTANSGTECYTGFRISKAGKVWFVNMETLTGKVTASTTET